MPPATNTPVSCSGISRPPSRWNETPETPISVMTIKDVPLATNIAFYQAPDDYPEPIFLLKTGERVFAVSTQSCQAQAFQEAPPDLGVKLGAFRVKNDAFQFVPSSPDDKPEEE